MQAGTSLPRADGAVAVTWLGEIEQRQSEDTSAKKYIYIDIMELVLHNYDSHI